MNEVTRTFYSDPGHGWLKVSYDELVELGIETSISQYSYRNGEDVFLEEDCDYGRYARAMEDRGINLNINEIGANGDSIIRSYNRYSITVNEASYDCV